MPVYGHTATLLSNGQVLVAGGANLPDVSQVAVAAAKLYNPVTNSWSATGELATARVLHTATLLTNGKVLVVGGSPGLANLATSGYLSSTELYDPATAVWTPSGSLMGYVTYGAIELVGVIGQTATLLPMVKYSSPVAIAASEEQSPQIAARLVSNMTRPSAPGRR